MDTQELADTIQELMEIKGVTNLRQDVTDKQYGKIDVSGLFDNRVVAVCVWVDDT